jgi:hypothetical protein
MSASDVRILSDGSCELLTMDPVTLDDVTVRWATGNDLAIDWLAESRADALGPAHDFLWSACCDPPEGIVPVVVALAEAAGEDMEMLGSVGAGPLEDLVHSASKDARLLDALERAARQEPSVRTAMRTVWMGPDVAPTVKQRLMKYGAQDISG